MDIKQIKIQIKRDFNNAMCLMGIIPFAVFIYLLAGRLRSFVTLTIEDGYVIFITIVILLLGVITGRKMIWMVIRRLFDFNQQILQLQKELIAKNRLAAVTETALALSHEVNNPLMIARGNLDLLEEDFKQTRVADYIKEKLDKVKDGCERIRTATDKLSNLSKEVTTTIHNDVKMIDLGMSERKK